MDRPTDVIGKAISATHRFYNATESVKRRAASNTNREDCDRRAHGDSAKYLARYVDVKLRYQAGGPFQVSFTHAFSTYMHNAPNFGLGPIAT